MIFVFHSHYLWDACIYTYSFNNNHLCISDFTIKSFNHFPVVTCPAEGQIFISGCVPTATCEDPNATAICASTGGACGCPDGKVLSKELNACVDLSECSKLLLLL